VRKNRRSRVKDMVLPFVRCLGSAGCGGWMVLDG
jgi:hypothetical protein